MVDSSCQSINLHKLNIGEPSLGLSILAYDFIPNGWGYLVNLHKNVEDFDPKRDGVKIINLSSHTTIKENRELNVGESDNE